MSDQDNSIFNGNQDNGNQQQTQQTPSVDNSLNDLLGSIKNEKGEQKYKTVQEALIGLQNAQQFITTLRTEKATIEAQLNEVLPVANKVTQLEQTVNELLNGNKAQPTNGVSEEQIARYVEQTLSQREQQQVAKTNLTTVVDTLKQVLGDEAETTFYARAGELGFSKAEINQLAARTPKAVLKMLGIEDKQPTRNGSTVTTSTVNTTALEPNKQTNIGRNSNKLSVGATTQELHEESKRALDLVNELHSKGMTVDDLTKPSVYFKTFR